MNNPNNTIVPKLNSTYLADYAHFLLHSRLNDFADEMLKISREENVSFLQYFEILTEQEIIDLLLANTRELLKCTGKKNTPKYINLILKRCIDNQFITINFTNILAKDITDFTYIYRKAFRRFLPDYTANMATSMHIIEEVDRFTSTMEEISFNMLFHLNEQKIDSYYSKGKKTFPKLENNNQQLPDISHKIDGLGSFAWDFEGNSSMSSLQLLNFFELHDINKLKSFMENVHPLDTKKIIEAREKSLLDFEFHDCCYRFQKINNEKVIWSRGIVTFQDGKPVKIKGSMMDVTQNFLLNQQLKESEKTFRQLIQNAPDAIIVIDENNNILLWNPKAEKIFGWTADEIIGKKLVETIIPPQYKEVHLEGIKQLYLSGRSNFFKDTIEITAVNKKKKEFFISLSIANSLLNGKQVFISFIRDISKEKKIENELEQRRNQLSQKNMELEKSNTELTSFSYVASHDLKEPLRKIKTYSNFIIEKNKDTLPIDAKEYIQRIITSATNMQLLIDDLLAFSRTASAEKKLESLDLNILLEEVENSLKGTIEDKNVTITSTKLPTLNVVTFQFRQLFENIIGNAIKYSKADVKPNITIISSIVSGKRYADENADPEKNYHRILFADSGIGFDQKYAKRIFEIFQRLHGKNEYSGTGVGLAICKKIMENHSGFITAQSIEGEGSVFNIFIPVSEAKNIFATD